MCHYSVHSDLRAKLGSRPSRQVIWRKPWVSGQGGGGARGVFYHLILMARLLLAITQNKAVLLADVAQLYDFIFHFRQIRLDLTTRLEVSDKLLK